MDTVFSTVIAAGAALLAAWLTHQWGEQTFQRREAETKAERAASVRLLISTEIDQNLAALAAFQSQLRGSKRPVEFIAHQAPPTVSRVAWETQFGEFSRAFDLSDLQRVLHVYRSLDRLAAIQRELATMRERDHYAKSHPPPMPDAFGRGYSPGISMPELWDKPAEYFAKEWIRIADDLLADANPLRR